MPDVVICEALRTPIGRFQGGLSTVRPDDLLAHVFKAVVERTGIDPTTLDDVFAGCANQAGEDNRNVADVGLYSGVMNSTRSVGKVSVTTTVTSSIKSVRPSPSVSLRSGFRPYSSS